MPSTLLKRRTLLTAAAALPWATLNGCSRGNDPPSYDGGWVGANAARGHLLRDLLQGNKSGAMPAPDRQRRASVLIVGAGIAGLGAARALLRAGIDDIHVFELEDSAGGNSRGHAIAGMACPLGAHYLPLPGDEATEVIALLEEFGLRRTEHGRPVYDERTLCHSPQERLFIDGHWHEGLLPPIEALPMAEQATTRAQYRRFGALVEQVGRGGAFRIPTAQSRWTPSLAALDAVTFTHWLDAEGLTAPALRWYLDYCCRDDYGAGAAQVSAWAGLHYFASRHGFHAPGEMGGDRIEEEQGGVLTWPEGNAWLSRRLAAPLNGGAGDRPLDQHDPHDQHHRHDPHDQRLHTGCIALRLDEGRFDVSLDVWHAAAQRTERWTAPQLVLAVPLFIAARLLVAPPAALVAANAAMRHAPWLVGNLHIDAPLDDPPGAPPSWDNVRYDAGSALPSLGYVDAMHQSTRSTPGPTVLTTYWALGGNDAAALAQQRATLLSQPWQAWSQRVVAELTPMHPDLPDKLRRVDLMRHGHAMSIPTPGLRSSAALQALAAPQRRVHFAHSDLSAYSVFEEALTHGMRAGLAAAGGGPGAATPWRRS